MYKLAVVGGGRMGEALVSGLVHSAWAEPEQIVVSEIHAARRDLLHKTYGVAVTDDTTAAVAGSDAVLIAVKPQDIDEALQATAEGVRDGQLVISIAAGIPIRLIERHLPSASVVRAMPNTPALLREGATAIADGTHADDDHLAQARAILEAVSRVVHLPEKHLDAVTGVSGTGPAYVFFLAEALIEAAVGVGLPREVATELSVQTLLGAARMLSETGRHPVELREEVTSPGGTTVAAMRVLERAGVRSAFLDAVRAATDRSRELAEGHE
ncbi:MAG TPA: pyrroline-5-carboxylate reductase [Actinomycetota bacterium]